MNLSINFAMIAWLVVVVRRDPGTTNPFSSLLDAFQINIKALFLTFYCFSKKKTKKKKKRALSLTSALFRVSALS